MTNLHPPQKNLTRDFIEQKLNQANDLSRSPPRNPAHNSQGASPASDFDLNPELRRRLNKGRRLRAAAVLMPLIERPGGLSALFTKRTDTLTNHAGQISFPGGKVEKSDFDAVATALRETREEIGLNESFINISGTLQNYETGTGFRITPVVGFVRLGFTLTIDPGEVAETFEVPLDFLLDPANHRLQTREWQGMQRRFYAISCGERLIWGATAGMIVSLYRTIEGLK